MKPIFYDFDVVSTTMFMSDTGQWVNSNDTYYYAIIPLEIGISYTITLQKVVNLSRFRCVQSNSNIIGNTDVSFVVANDTPTNGYAMEFVAEKKYLICYCGTSNNGKVVLIKKESSQIKLRDLTGAKITWNDDIILPSSYTPYSINFTSNVANENYVGMNLYSNVLNYAYPSGSSALSILAYQVTGWTNVNLKTIYIVDGDDVTNINLISYVLENATVEGGIWEEETKITYNETTTTITEGQTATIKCEEGRMKTDIVVSGKCKITYNNVETNVEEGQVATIKCKEYKMYSDVLVEVAKAITAYKASVTGLGNSSPTSQVYTRDDNFPTSFEEVTDSLGNIFVKIPTMYRKVDSVVDNQITAFTMSTAKVDDTYEPYSVFVKPNGTVMPYVLIGKYCYNSSSSANSTSSGSGDLTIGKARTYAQALGSGYQIYDWQFQKLFVDLCLLISQKVNFNSGKQMDNYLGVYGLIKGIWIDGVSRDETTWCVAYDPTKYVDKATSSTDGYVSAGYNAPNPTSSQEIKKLGYNTANPFFNYPNETISNSSSNTYYCDDFSYANGNYPVYSTVGYSFASNGLWCCYTHLNWSFNMQTARLCYRPLDESI